jgi:hypothetical protein
VNFAGGVEPAYTFEHYVSAPDTQDQDGTKFDNKVKRVMKELWVSLPHTILLNTSHSYHILEIMTTYIMSICRISSNVTRDTMRGPLGGSQSLLQAREGHALRGVCPGRLQYHPIFEERKVHNEAARNMTLTKEQYLLVNTDFF